MLKNDVNNNKKQPSCFNAENIFQFSHKKNKSSNILPETQGNTNTNNTPYIYSCSNTTTNNIINKQTSKTNINNLNINININTTNPESKNTQKVIDTNPSSVNKINKKKESLIANYFKKKTKTESPNVLNNIAVNIKYQNDAKDEIPNYSSMRQITEPNQKNSIKAKLQKNTNKELLPSGTPKQMLISYGNMKNLLNRKNLKLNFQKQFKSPLSEKNPAIRKEIINRSKQKKLNTECISQNNNISTEDKLVKLTKQTNNFVQGSKNLIQSKSFYNDIKINPNNQIGNLIYLNTNTNFSKNNIFDQSNYKENDNSKKNSFSVKEKISNIDKVESTNNGNSKKKGSFFINNINFKTKNSKSNSNNRKVRKRKNINLCKKSGLLIMNPNQIVNSSNNENYIKEKSMNSFGNRMKKGNNLAFLNEYKNSNIESPEELHFFFVKVLQNGKEIGKKFEKKFI